MSDSSPEHQIIPIPQETENRKIEPQRKDRLQLTTAGQIANKIASRHVFHRYLQEKSINTLKRHARDLEIFAEYLREMQIPLPEETDFQNDPEAWRGVSWGLVEGFLSWLLREGYAINTVNARLYTVRTYSRLAVKSGVLSHEEGSKIEAVRGFSRKTGLHADDKRLKTRKKRITYTYTPQEASQEIEVERRSTKKEKSTQIGSNEAAALMAINNSSAQAMRDAFLMCLLLEHGLRASEIARLAVDCLNLETHLLHFTRPKVRGTDHEFARHKLTTRTLIVARNYLQKFYPEQLGPSGPLILGTTRLKKDGTGGDLRPSGLNRIRVSERVAYLGAQLGIDSLSAHDCRHYCATHMARLGYGVDELMAWFGWTNAQTAMKYVHAAEVLKRSKG